MYCHHEGVRVEVRTSACACEWSVLPILCCLSLTFTSQSKDKHSHLIYSLKQTGLTPSLLYIRQGQVAAFGSCLSLSKVYISSDS